MKHNEHQKKSTRVILLQPKFPGTGPQTPQNKPHRSSSGSGTVVPKLSYCPPCPSKPSRQYMCLLADSIMCLWCPLLEPHGCPSAPPGEIPQLWHHQSGPKRVLTAADQESGLSLFIRRLGTYSKWQLQRYQERTQTFPGGWLVTTVCTRLNFPVNMSIQKAKLVRSCLVSIELEQMELWSVGIFHQTGRTDWTALLLSGDISVWITRTGPQINTDMFYF